MKYLLIVFCVLVTFPIGNFTVDARGHNEEGGVVAGEEGGVISGPSAVLTNPLSNISSIPDFFRVLVEIILVFAIPFIVFFIIYAGFLYVTARGNPEKISTAHKALLFALIGGMLILGANVLLEIITNTVEQIN
jgi:hypothetical protein